MRTGLGNRKHLRVLGGRDEHEQTSTTWEASQTNTSTTWEASQTNTIKMPVPPHTCMTITRMEGVYGTPALSPYTIGAHNYHVYQRPAE